MALNVHPFRPFNMSNRLCDRPQPAHRPACAGGLSFLLLSLTLMSCSSSPEAQEARYLSKAKSLVAKKEYARALIEFKNAAKAKPKDAEPYYQVGLAYLAKGDPEDAFSSFRAALARDPNHAGAQLKLAEFLSSTNRKDLVEQARTRLEKIVAGSPNKPEASDALAATELKLGDTVDAVKRLEETVTRFPSDLKSSATLARVKIHQNDMAGAEEILKKAVASAPQSAEAELALGGFYMALQDRGKSELEIQKALHLDPKNGPALLALGRIQVAEKRLSEADQTYQRVAALPDPQYKPFHAIYLYSIGRKEDALKEFERLAKDDPEDRPARTRLLALYLELGKTAEAQKLLEAALKKNAKDTDALLQRSALYVKWGKTAEAERDLNQVLHYQPDSPQAHYVLAHVYHEQGLQQHERQELNEALRLKPEMVAARLTLAKVFLASNEAKAALDLLNQTPAQQKTLAGVIEQRNWALLATNATTEVEAELKHDLQAGRVPELVTQEAVLKMMQHDLPAARAAADEVLKSRPDDVRAVEVIVNSYAAEKQPEKAMAILQQLTAEQPKSASLQFMAAKWYLRRGKAAEARRALELAKAADPKLVDADIVLAELDRSEKRGDAARQRVAGVIAAYPKNVQARLLMAMLNEDSGNREAASQDYRAILDVDSSNIAALNNLAYHLAVEKPDEALRLAQQAAELAPDSATVQDTLGWVYFHKGLYDSALGYLKAAFAKQPTPKRQYHLAICYLKAGNQDDGMKNLRAALQKDPSLNNEP